MNMPNLILRLQTSKLFRLSVEILASFVFLFWLPLIAQIVGAVIISFISEIFFSKAIEKSFRQEFSGKNWSEILNDCSKSS